MYRRFLSVRYLKTRFVNFLSIAGVMMGVAVMIVVTSVMDGFQEKVRDVLRGTLSHLVFEPTGKVVNADGSPAPDPTFEEVEARLRADPDVTAVAPQVVSFMAHPWAGGALGRDTNFFLIQAVGIDWRRETGVLPTPKGETAEQKRERLAKEGAAAVSKLAEYLVAVRNRDNPFDDEKARYYEKTTAIFSLSFLESFLGTSPGGPREVPRAVRRDHGLPPADRPGDRRPEVQGADEAVLRRGRLRLEGREGGPAAPLHVPDRPARAPPTSSPSTRRSASRSRTTARRTPSSRASSAASRSRARSTACW